MPKPRPKIPRRGAQGLSRLEALLALVVVAVLMALLLTRLAELDGMARPARLQAAAASARAAAMVFHARCEALRQREAGADCTRLELDGTPVAGAHGWPAASAEGIARAVRLPDGRLTDFRLQAVMRGGLPALSFALGERGSGCEFLYVQAKGPDVFPEVDIVDASCH
jgi:hypothetical protein